MADTPEQAVRKLMAALKEKTGKSFDEWKAIVAGCGIDKHAAIVAHLKADHGLTHGYANMIVLKARGTDAGSADRDDLVEQVFAGPKAAMRPLYDRVIAIVQGFGDVELSPKKGYVSLRRKKQFALAQPSTKDRLDLGLILKGAAPGGRLEASGSFNAMVTHRVRLASIAEIDAEVQAWLRQAWEAAG